MSQDIGDSHFAVWAGSGGVLWDRPLPTYLVPGFGQGCSMTKGARFGVEDPEAEASVSTRVRRGSPKRVRLTWKRVPRAIYGPVVPDAGQPNSLVPLSEAMQRFPGLRDVGASDFRGRRPMPEAGVMRPGSDLVRALGVIDPVELIDLPLELLERGGKWLFVEPTEQGLVEAFIFALRRWFIGFAGDRLDTPRAVT